MDRTVSAATVRDYWGESLYMNTHRCKEAVGRDFYVLHATMLYAELFCVSPVLQI